MQDEVKIRRILVKLDEIRLEAKARAETNASAEDGTVRDAGSETRHAGK